MEDLQQYVSDARRVISYSARSGLLSNSDLVQSVNSAEDHLARNVPLAGDEFVLLVTRLNAAIAAIYPVNLIDLGSRWRPFAESKQSKTTRVIFAVISVFIIVITGYYTNLYIRTNDVLAGLTQIQQKDPLDKAFRLFRLVKRNPGVTSVENAGSDDLHFEPYLRSYEEIYSINDDIGTYMPEAQQLAISAYHLPLWTEAKNFLSPPRERSSLEARAGHVAGSTGQPVAAKYSQIHGYNEAYSPGAYGKAGPSAGAATHGPANASVSNDAPAPGGVAEGPGGPDVDSRTNFLQHMGVALVAFQTSENAFAKEYSIARLITICRGIIELYGGIILPSLYGMLGTIVFEMRKMLNPLRPSASSERVVVRAALGGLAGLSITFVFKPLHMAGGAEQLGGVAIFGAAFILGFSIDVFFLLLDRMVNFLSQSIAGANRA